MKIKKIIVLAISIIIPLFITVMVALYSYGIVGNWTTNGVKFIDHVFEETNNSQETIELYAKFNSTHYKNNYQNVSLYKDYTTGTEKIENDLPYCDLGTFKFQYYTLISTNEKYKTYTNQLYFFDIDNTENYANKMVFLFVNEESKDSVTNLNIALNRYQKQIDDSTIIDTIYSPSFTYISTNMFWTNGDRLVDKGGRGIVTADTVINPYIRLYKPAYTYYLDDSENVTLFTDLDYCNFAIILLDDATNPTSMKVLGTGQIENIQYDQEKYLENNTDVCEGYGLETIPALNKAGYFKFVFPTLLWQTSIALVISGLLGFLFYRSWSNDQKKKEKQSE